MKALEDILNSDRFGWIVIGLFIAVIGTNVIRSYYGN